VAQLKTAAKIETYDAFWKSIIPTLPALPPEIQQLGQSQQGLPQFPTNP
jgi:hypothetical protein